MIYLWEIVWTFTGMHHLTNQWKYQIILLVHNSIFIDNDLSLGDRMDVYGDASFNKSMEITDNLLVHNSIFIDNDLSLGDRMDVYGDASFNKSMEISDNVLIHNSIFIVHNSIFIDDA